MKIIFITHNIKGNDGWGRYAKDLSLEAKHAGHDVVCIVNEIDNSINIEQKLLLKKPPVSYISNIFLSFINSILINKCIKEFEPDIVHFIVEPYTNILPFLKYSKAKIVLTVHSTFAYMPILVNGFSKNICRFLSKRYFKRINAIIAVSNFTKKHLLNCAEGSVLQYITEDKIKVISGGVNIYESNSIGCPDKKNTKKEILFVGAVKPRKGLLESIDALAKVKNVDFIYRIVGSCENTSYLALIKSKIVTYNLEDKIIFAGQVSDMDLKMYYSNADLFLMLSTNNGLDFEGYGLVYIEANSYGVPVIGPNDSGVSEAISNGFSGYLVNNKDPKTVAKLIESILVDKTIMRENCVKWAHKNSNKEKFLLVNSLYNSLFI